MEVVVNLPIASSVSMELILLVLKPMMAWTSFRLVIFF